MIRSRSIHIAATALSTIAFAGAVEAQGLLSSQGTIVATDGDPVPDASGAPIPGLTFGGTGALGDNPVVDETGRLLFRARIAGGSPTATTERAFFYGSSRADLRLVVRGGDAAPGLPTGFVLAHPGGAVSPFAGAVRLSPDGRMAWGSYIADPLNGTVDSQNDEAWFGGPFGAQTLFARQGDLAPGTVGAMFAQAFSSPNVSTNGIDREGRIYFHGTLSGGDVVGTDNQAGIWAGMPGALELVARRGSPTPGMPGTEIATTGLALGTFGQLNDAGRLLYQLTLSTTAGATPATLANDTVLMAYTPGVGSTPILREGATAPGTAGGTFNATTGDSWSPSLGPNAWTRAGTTFFETELIGGDVVADFSDRALYRAGNGAPILVARRASPAPGTDALFEDWNAASLGILASGRVCFQGTLYGGTSSQSDDTGLWSGHPGALQVVVRENQPMPGTGGALAGHINGGLVAFNELGQILFNIQLVGGSTPGNSLWMWDPALGVQPIVLMGDVLAIGPGVNKTINSFAFVTNNDSAGAALGFTHDGSVALRVGFTDGTAAIATMRLPVPVTAPSAFCFGDGSGTLCPCGNSGAPGNGCANSLFPDGANLAADGASRLSADTLRLVGSGMPNSSALYFQGTTQLVGGLGVTFGDGLRCAGGSVIRLGTKPNQGGASAYPGDADPRISVRGLVTTPGTRTYQVWYRNAAAFCTTSTYNVTNGILVSWFP